MVDVVDFYNGVANEYDGHFMRPIDLAENQVVFQHLCPLLAGKRVLDLGCGTSLILDYIDPPADYVGVDLSANMLAFAYDRFPGGTFLNCDIRSINGRFPRQSFDVVLSTFGSISYLPSLEPIPGILDEQLRPGGSFFLMVYGDRYRGRRHHISANLSYQTYSRKYLLNLFDAKVYGFNSLPDMLPFNKSLLTTLLRFDLLGRVLPSLAYFLIVEGVR